MLVDRLWPRGLTKEKAAIDEWARAIAPSDALRRWYGHAPGRWPEFRARYLSELEAVEARETLERLRARVAAGPLTLLTATRNQIQIHATVLCEILGG